MIDKNNLKGYRVGTVTRVSFENCSCCKIRESSKPIFKYIELFYEGDEKYIYEDEEAYKVFEDDFMSRRFTSYHEFFTTKEPALEDRDLFKLEYYIRKDRSKYMVMPLEAALEELKDVERFEDRVTELGQYANKAE